jgi:hypothetical protein
VFAPTLTLFTLFTLLLGAETADTVTGAGADTVGGGGTGGSAFNRASTSWWLIVVVAFSAVFRIVFALKRVLSEPTDSVSERSDGVLCTEEGADPVRIGVEVPLTSKLTE